MTTVELRFPANRYHGTAWGRHVNEGVPEWPPSPYRLLRALFDVWKRKCAYIGEDDVRNLFTALAGQPPYFQLPKVVAAHTRSYLSSNRFDSADKSLIFDAFVAVAPQAKCLMQWTVTLDERQRLLLAELLSVLNYFGRSESWVEAALCRMDTALKCNCVPVSEAGTKGEIVYVACPVPASEYSGNWLEAITYSSGRILKERMSGPPAMRTVPYMFTQADAVVTWLPARFAPRERGISAAVLELHGSVLPPATETIRIAERIRGRLMKWFERSGKPIPALIHGKDADGRPLKDHSHLFILPQPNTEGRIETVLLYSLGAQGFSSSEIQAIAGIRAIHWMESDSVGVTPTWMGRRDDVSFRLAATKVISTTPFVTARHWRKGRGTFEEFLIEEVRRECRNHSLPEPAHVTEIPMASRFPPVKFRRHRKDDAPRPGYAFRIEFDRPVPVPFALGYGCHFGLGQFNAEG